MKKVNTFNQFIAENIQQVQAQTQVQLNKDDIILNKVNKIIDYTVIKPGTIKEKVKESIIEAIEFGYYGVVVEPELVDFCNFEIEDANLKTISTLDFPSGEMKTTEKLNETIKIISDDADEIDMAIDIKEFKKAYLNDDIETKNSSYLKIENEIKEISDECHKSGVLLKVVIESGLLSLEELKDICNIVANANVDFIQTSTGMKEIGAELSKVKEMRRLLPDYIKIKAAGGIRSIKDANAFYPFVDRIGTSVVLK